MMRQLMRVFSLFALTATAAGHAETARDILNRSVEQQAAGLHGVDDLRQVTETMGLTQLEYFEKSALDINGETVFVLRSVSPQEMAQRRSEGGFADASSADLRHAARVLEEQGEVMEQEMNREIAQVGLPGGLGEMLMNAPSDQPWLSPNPKHMMGMYATVLNTAADGKDAEANRDPAADARGRNADMAELASRTELLGRDTLDGREAFHLAAANLNHTQVTDGQEFTLNTVSMWIDTEHYVPLRMRMEGVLREGRETRPITIEREDKDYRSVPGCGRMYEPFQSVMRIAGMMTPEQQAEMRKAQAQMADLEKQLEQMPPGQRAMIMGRMGPQMEMMENMASGGGLEVTSNVVDLRCNEGMPDPREMMTAFSGLGGPMVSGGVGSIDPVPDGSLGSPAPAAESVDQRAQEACLREKMAAAQEAQKKKRGFGRLIGAVGRTAARFGNLDLGRAAGDLYSANATREDLAQAARDLGLTEADVDDCRNPT